MKRGVRLVLALSAVVVALGTATPAQAFDTGPHQEMTADALSAQGFGTDAIGVTQINNWFTDLYHHLAASHLPHSGHSGFLERMLVGVLKTEKWPNEVINASTRMHFDDWPEVETDAEHPTLGARVGLTAEWNRLRRVTLALVEEAKAEDNPEKLLAVLGISLHPLQDFYTHTNWIEAQPGHGVAGSDGPGWDERGYGSYPTWWDLPADVREEANLYGDSTYRHREHGLWNADGNQSLVSVMNKDWPGRPYYLKAAITARYATEQWIAAVRSWVNDEGFWARAQRYRANQKQLDHDLDGRFNLMLYSGHWQGQGEPFGAVAPGRGGSLFDLKEVVKNYFERGTFGPSSKTEYRARFERLIGRMAERGVTGPVKPVPSSQDLQRSTRIVVLKVTNLRGEGLGDPGPDSADMYADIKIGGQLMHSAVIHGEDKFNFPDPYEPFTWFKVVPAVPDRPEPVESVEVEVKTADVRWAGTDDDVFLRLGAGLRYPLDKRLYNDFERNDRDTYSVPIDAEVKAGMTVDDITQVQIEKSRDLLAGGWKLGGVVLRVNGRVLYENKGVNRWLEDDNRTWRAPDFVRRNPRGAKIPVWLTLEEDDSLYGANDHGDINPYDKRRTVSIGYAPGPPLQRKTVGSSLLGGRLFGDGDEASIVYRLETVTPVPMPALGAPTPPPTTVGGGKPDLVITEFFFDSVTVENRGAGSAAPFRLRAANERREEIVVFPGLAPGGSATRLLSLRCDEFFFATVDDLEQIDEADETNNEVPSLQAFC